MAEQLREPVKAMKEEHARLKRSKPKVHKAILCAGAARTISL